MQPQVCSSPVLVTVVDDIDISLEMTQNCSFKRLQCVPPIAPMSSQPVAVIMVTDVSELVLDAYRCHLAW